MLFISVATIDVRQRYLSIDVQLTDGDELAALRRMCDSVSKQKWIFSDFQVCVHIETEEGRDPLEEVGTVDAGGPTCRFLTAAWAALFGGTPVSIGIMTTHVNHSYTTIIRTASCWFSFSF